MAIPSSITKQIVIACEKAGRSLIHDFKEVENLQVARKGPADFVSIADKKSENILKERLLKLDPESGILSEESEEIQSNNGERWIIDPLDGTTNFLHGFPHFAVSVGLERNNVIEIGVVYNPISAEIFWAEKGKGAFLGQHKIKVSNRKQIETALIEAYMKRGENNFIKTEKIPTYVPMRSQGSAALSLAYVAAGRIDACWWNSIKPWDVAAGVIIVQEAGGLTLNLLGKAYSNFEEKILATNIGLRSYLVDTLKD